MGAHGSAGGLMAAKKRALMVEGGAGYHPASRRAQSFQKTWWLCLQTSVLHPHQAREPAETGYRPPA